MFIPLPLQVEPLELVTPETQAPMVRRVQQAKLVPLSFLDKKSQHRFQHQQLLQI
jgi:hypothetical protein